MNTVADYNKAHGKEISNKDSFKKFHRGLIEVAADSFLKKGQDLVAEGVITEEQRTNLEQKTQEILDTLPCASPCIFWPGIKQTMANKIQEAAGGPKISIEGINLLLGTTKGIILANFVINREFAEAAEVEKRIAKVTEEMVTEGLVIIDVEQNLLTINKAFLAAQQTLNSEIAQKLFDQKLVELTPDGRTLIFSINIAEVGELNLIELTATFQPAILEGIEGIKVGPERISARNSFLENIGESKRVTLEELIPAEFIPEGLPPAEVFAPEVVPAAVTDLQNLFLTPQGRLQNPDKYMESVQKFRKEVNEILLEEQILTGKANERGITFEPINRLRKGFQNLRALAEKAVAEGDTKTLQNIQEAIRKVRANERKFEALPRIVTTAEGNTLVEVDRVRSLSAENRMAFLSTLGLDVDLGVFMDMETGEKFILKFDPDPATLEQLLPILAKYPELPKAKWDGLGYAAGAYDQIAKETAVVEIFNRLGFPTYDVGEHTIENQNFLAVEFLEGAQPLDNYLLMAEGRAKANKVALRRQVENEMGEENLENYLMALTTAKTLGNDDLHVGNTLVLTIDGKPTPVVIDYGATNFGNRYLTTAASSNPLAGMLADLVPSAAAKLETKLEETGLNNPDVIAEILTNVNSKGGEALGPNTKKAWNWPATNTIEQAAQEITQQNIDELMNWLVTEGKKDISQETTPLTPPVEVLPPAPVELPQAAKELSELEQTINKGFFEIKGISKAIEAQIVALPALEPEITSGRYTNVVSNIDKTVEHTIDVAARTESRIPPFIIEKLKTGRTISMHEGTSAEAIAELKEQGFTDFQLVSSKPKEKTTWKVWTASNDQGELTYFITDIRGKARMNHIQAMLHLSDVPASIVSVYDYNHDYSQDFVQTLEQMVEKPDILIMGDQGVILEGYLNDGYIASKQTANFQDLFRQGLEQGLPPSQAIASHLDVDGAWFSEYYAKQAPKLLLSGQRSGLRQYLQAAGRQAEIKSIMKEVNKRGAIDKELLDQLNVPPEQQAAILEFAPKTKEQLHADIIQPLITDLNKLFANNPKYDQLLSKSPEEIFKDRVTAQKVKAAFDNLIKPIKGHNLINQFAALKRPKSFFKEYKTPYLSMFSFQIKTADGGVKNVIITPNPYGDLSGELTKAALDYSTKHPIDDIIFLGAGGSLSSDVDVYSIYMPTKIRVGDQEFTIPNAAAADYQQGKLQSETTPVRFTTHVSVDTVFEETIPFMNDLIRQGIETTEVEVRHIVEAFNEQTAEVIENIRPFASDQQTESIKAQLATGAKIDKTFLQQIGIPEANIDNILDVTNTLPSLSIIQHVSDMPLVPGKTLEVLGFQKPPDLQKDKYANILFGRMDATGVLAPGEIPPVAPPVVPAPSKPPLPSIAEFKEENPEVVADTEQQIGAAIDAFFEDLIEPQQAAVGAVIKAVKQKDACKSPCVNINFFMGEIEQIVRDGLEKTDIEVTEEQIDELLTQIKSSKFGQTLALYLYNGRVDLAKDAVNVARRLQFEGKNWIDTDMENNIVLAVDAKSASLIQSEINEQLGKLTFFTVEEVDGELIYYAGGVRIEEANIAVLKRLAAEEDLAARLDTEIEDETVRENIREILQNRLRELKPLLVNQ